MFWFAPPALADDVRDAGALIESLHDARVARGAPRLPTSVYERASKGEIVTGTAAPSGGGVGTGWAVAVVDRPADELWVALNSEETHVGRFDLVVSEVVAGDARGSGRRVWQVVDLPAWFADRWLVVDETFGGEVYRRSAGRLWEIGWTDATKPENLGGRTPPGGAVPVGSTRGGWLLAALPDGRTLVQVHSATDPGGSVPASAATSFAASALADSVRDLVDVARGLIGRSRRGYRRPDGSAL